jgi:transcriptional regulator of acetoin/glycerol metabolism
MSAINVGVGSRGEIARVTTVNSGLSLNVASLISLRDLKRVYLVGVLRAVGGNISRAAEILEVNRRSIYRMMKDFGLEMSHCGRGE